MKATATADPPVDVLLQMVEMARDGLVLLDSEHRYLYASPAARVLLGIAGTDVLGHDFLAHFPVPERAAIAEQLTPDERAGLSSVHVHKGEERAIEYEVRRHVVDGKPLWILALRDLTSRRREGIELTRFQDLEAQLRESVEQYRGIFEATNDALIITDFDGYCVEANPAACRLYGYRYDEMIGKNAAEVTHADYHGLAQTFVETVRAGGTIEARSVNLRKDGTAFHIETRASELMFRGKPHILAVIRDVSERVTAQELLERRVEERTRELTALLDVSRNVSSTLDLRPLMDLILDQIARVVEYAGATISLVDGDDTEIVAYRGPGSAALIGLRVPVNRVDSDPESWRSGPLIIDDVQADTPEAIAYRRNESDLLDSSFAYVRSWMAVPLRFNDRLVGVLTLNGAQPGIYTPHHADLILGIASQAAIAIENARLYEQAQAAAVFEERQRLSRELHDSVSQSLYGIVLGAQTARALAERDPAQVIAPLDYVLSLARTGMVDMRTLIFELRPETLEQEGLAAVLEKQASATTAQHQIPVITALCDEPDIALATKEALYRIAQEALHNAVKHAQATELRLSMERTGDEIVLAIRDNGKGFDMSGSFPGHLGLHSMRERAARFGGTLQLESKVGVGTTISVRVSVESG